MINWLMKTKGSKAHHPELPQELLKSLKFNMATVLFADIHGLSKVMEGMDSGSVMDDWMKSSLSLSQSLRNIKYKRSRP